MGKGSKRRPGDDAAYAANYARIFGDAAADATGGTAPESQSAINAVATVSITGSSNGPNSKP